MKVPCENCICIPVCKNKQYLHMKDDCEPIKRFLNQGFRSSKIVYRAELVFEILKPSLWGISDDDKFGHKWVTMDVHAVGNRIRKSPDYAYYK